MKHVAVIVGAALLVIARQTMADPPTPAQRTEATKLLDGLPSRSELHHANDVLTKQGYTDAERARARKLLDVAEERIPKLRPLIAEGAHVLDYPGLLAAGETIFIDNRGEHPGVGDKFYRLFIGITAQTGEGHVPNLFGIDFDEQDKILKVLRPGKLVL